MILFTDNDIVLKLAAFDLLDATIKMLHGQEFFVLDAAAHRLRKPSARNRQLHDSDSIARALQFCERAKALGALPHVADEAALAGANYEDENGEMCQVDNGELILFSEAFRGAESLLVTGDKKSIYAFGRHANEAPLAQRPHVQAMRNGLQGRVVCLEATILALCTEIGFEEVRAHIVPQRRCDQAMKSVFGSGLQSTQTNAHSALETYLNHAERSLGVGWLWRA